MDAIRGLPLLSSRKASIAKSKGKLMLFCKRGSPEQCQDHSQEAALYYESLMDSNSLFLADLNNLKMSLEEYLYPYVSEFMIRAMFTGTENVKLSANADAFFATLLQHEQLVDWTGSFETATHGYILSKKDLLKVVEELFYKNSRASIADMLAEFLFNKGEHLTMEEKGKFLLPILQSAVTKNNEPLARNILMHHEWMESLLSATAIFNLAEHYVEQGKLAELGFLLESQIFTSRLSSTELIKISQSILKSQNQELITYWANSQKLVERLPSKELAELIADTRNPSGNFISDQDLLNIIFSSKLLVEKIPVESILTMLKLEVEQKKLPFTSALISLLHNADFLNHLPEHDLDMLLKGRYNALGVQKEDASFFTTTNLLEKISETTWRWLKDIPQVQTEMAVIQQNKIAKERIERASKSTFNTKLEQALYNKDVKTLQELKNGCLAMLMQNSKGDETSKQVALQLVDKLPWDRKEAQELVVRASEVHRSMLLSSHTFMSLFDVKALIEAAVETNNWKAMQSILSLPRPKAMVLYSLETNPEMETLTWVVLMDSYKEHIKTISSLHPLFPSAMLKLLSFHHDITGLETADVANAITFLVKHFPLSGPELKATVDSLNVKDLKSYTSQPFYVLINHIIHRTYSSEESALKPHIVKTLLYQVFADSHVKKDLLNVLSKQNDVKDIKMGEFFKDVLYSVLFDKKPVQLKTLQRESRAISQLAIFFNDKPTAQNLYELLLVDMNWFTALKLQPALLKDSVAEMLELIMSKQGMIKGEKQEKPDFIKKKDEELLQWTIETHRLFTPEVAKRAFAHVLKLKRSKLHLSQDQFLLAFMKRFVKERDETIINMVFVTLAKEEKFDKVIKLVSALPASQNLVTGETLVKCLKFMALHSKGLQKDIQFAGAIGVYDYAERGVGYVIEDPTAGNILTGMAAFSKEMIQKLALPEHEHLLKKTMKLIMSPSYQLETEGVSWFTDQEMQYHLKNLKGLCSVAPMEVLYEMYEHAVHSPEDVVVQNAPAMTIVQEIVKRKAEEGIAGH